MTRVVDIPNVVSLAPVKAPECKLPSTLPLSSNNANAISPVVKPSSRLRSPSPSPTPNSVAATPPKFSGKAVEEIATMSETDQVITV